MRRTPDNAGSVEGQAASWVATESETDRPGSLVIAAPQKISSAPATGTSAMRCVSLS